MRLILAVIVMIMVVGFFCFAEAGDTLYAARKFAEEYQQEQEEIKGKAIAGSYSDEEKSQIIAFDFIYSRTLERKFKASSGETDKVKPMDQNHLKISYIKIEEIQPYVKLGMAKLKEKMGNVNVVGLGRRNIDLEYERAFSYGGGVNGKIDLMENWFIGYDGQYLRSEHKLDKVKHSGETASSKTGKIRLQEWRASLSLGKELNLGVIGEMPLKLAPYIGGHYSDLELKIIRNMQYVVSEGTIGIIGENKAKDKWGAFSGLNLNLGDDWRLNLEGRFLNETTFTGSIGFKF